MTSVGALNLYDTIQAAKLADLVASMSLTALTGQLDAFQERMHTVRGQIGQIQVAKNIRLLTEGCEILRNCQHARVQDAYALRCIPQVHGAVVNAALSNGLTPFLTTEGGVNSGFMIVQYSAASMVSENKVLAHPASVDSIPSSANQEDFVSMGTTAARKAGTILQNTLSVLALELLTACQAVDIRRRVNSHGTGISPVHEALYQRVRQDVAFYDVDREIWPDVRAVEKLVRSGELLEIAEEKVPALA